MKILKKKVCKGNVGNETSKENIADREIKMPKIVMLSPDILTVDKSYQRKIDFKRVRDIDNEFDPDLFGILVVSDRNGIFCVVDGQHRLLAVKGFLKEVPCALWQGLTYEEECEKFRKLNLNRKNLNASIIFHEMVCEGDKDAKEVVSIMSKYGFEYNRDSQTTKNNMIGSPMRMLKILEDNGAEALERLFFINRKAWHGVKEGLSATMLVGLNTFLSENPSVKNEYVIQTLESVEPNLIKGQASYYVTADNISGISGGSSRYVHIANAIKAAYNKTVPKNARII